MQWLSAQDAAQGLGSHRSLHRMEEGWSKAKKTADRIWHRLNCALGIAEVPGNPVPMAICVATPARQIALCRQTGIVKKTSPATDSGRLRIEANRCRDNLRARGGVDDADTLVKAIQHVEQVSLLIECQSSRTLAHCDPRLDSA